MLGRSGPSTQAIDQHAQPLLQGQFGPGQRFRIEEDAWGPPLSRTSGAFPTRKSLAAYRSRSLAKFLAIIVDMDVSIAEAKNRLPELIRAVEDGETIVITRHGKPVAQIAPPPPQRRKVRLGGMKHHIQLLAGWDATVDLDRLLAGDL